MSKEEKTVIEDTKDWNNSQSENNEDFTYIECFSFFAFYDEKNDEHVV